MMRTKEKIREKGAASLFIDLSDGILKVYHGTDKVILIERPIYEGEWDKIFKALENEQ